MSTCKRNIIAKKTEDIEFVQIEKRVFLSYKLTKMLFDNYKYRNKCARILRKKYLESVYVS